MQAKYNLSQNVTCGIASDIRSATKRRKIIESNLQPNLRTKIHSLDQYFTSEVFELTKRVDKKTTQISEIVTYCKDVGSLIKHVKEARNVGEVNLKFGIDGGGNFLKICLSILRTETGPVEEKRRRTYKEGTATEKFKDAGVKKLFILALVQCSQENYENVRNLWTALNLNDFEGTVATDLKIANIMVGIMCYSCQFPCTWCFAEKNNLEERGQLRSIQNTLENYQKWQSAGAIRSKAKNYMNCINSPIFTSASDRLFLEMIPPPELHLMLGVVNTLFTKMLMEFEDQALKWAKDCHVERAITRGMSAFNGNGCKTLLDKVDILRANSGLGCVKFVQTFQDFKKVVASCFGNSLNSNSKEKIAAFKKSYLALEISVTPKVHAVFFHIEDFCDRTQKGLGFFSEQAMESVHYDFNQVWLKYKVAREHPDYANRLRRAVCEYNSIHI